MLRDRRIAGRRIRRRRRIAARIDALTAADGFYLLSWQREALVSWIDGDRPVYPTGRRAGRSTLLDVVARVGPVESWPMPPQNTANRDPRRVR